MALFNYECDEIKRIIDEVSPNYPQLTTYEKEWLYFHKYGYIAGIPVELEYETVNVNPTGMVQNAIPHQYKSAILKGNTMTNYAQITSHNFDNSRTPIHNLNKPLETGKQYTIIINIVSQTITKGVMARFSKDSTNYTNVESFNGVGRHKLLYTATDNFNQFSPYVDFEEWKAGLRLEYNQLMIIEGDYTNVDIPYFEGMQSVKMPVLTTSNEDGTKTNILTVNEEVELRGIGEVKDELNLLTGELTERIGEVVLDGSEDWVQSSYGNTPMFYTSFNNLVHKVDYLNSISCDKLVVHTNDTSLSSSTSPNGISAYADRSGTYPNENWIYIKYTDSEGDVEKLKQCLSQNPITVQYELATESVKTIYLTKLNKPYEGTNHYQLTSNIPCEAILEVPVVSTGEQTLQEIND